jgi:hypothetical protein
MASQMGVSLNLWVKIAHLKKKTTFKQNKQQKTANETHSCYSDPGSLYSSLVSCQ